MALVVETRLIVAAAEHPSPGWQSAARRWTSPTMIGDRPDGRGGEIEISQRETDRHRMGMRVVQSRRGGATGQIDDLGARGPAAVTHLRVASGDDTLRRPDRHRGDPGFVDPSS